MEKNSSIPQQIQPLYDCLKRNEAELGLAESEMYVDFPVYKELDAEILVAQSMVISPRHGVLILQR